MGRLSLSEGWESVPERENGPERENVPGRDLKLFQLILNFLKLKQTVQTLIRCRVLRCLIFVCTVCQCCSPGFTDNPLYTAL